MQTIQKIRRESRKTANPLNTFGIFVLVTGALSVINTLVTLLLVGAFFSLAHKKPPTLVQLVDGKAISVSAMASSNDRAPAVVRQFVMDSMMALLSATGKLPLEPGAKLGSEASDAGVSIRTKSGDRRISTLTWQSSFALSQDFRPQAIASIADLTPPGAFNGQAQMTLITDKLSDPEKIADGQWKLILIARLETFSSDHPEGISVPFNKEIFVRAIDTPIPGDLTSTLQRAVYQTRQAGLEIYGMRDFQPGNLKP